MNDDFLSVSVVSATAQWDGLTAGKNGYESHRNSVLCSMMLENKRIAVFISIFVFIIYMTHTHTCM